MAGAGITITVNDAEVLAAFSRVAAASLDFTPLFDDIGASLVVSTQQRFETETDPSGKKWTPLRPSTKRARRGVPHILRDRNRLFRSLTHNATPSYLEVGTNVIYAAIHQFGGTIDLAAREQTANFRMASEGAYTKADGTKVGSRLRFAKRKSKSKRVWAKSFSIGAHSITIPARPYLGLSDGDKALILEKTEAYLMAAKGGAA